MLDDWELRRKIIVQLSCLRLCTLNHYNLRTFVPSSHGVFKKATSLQDIYFLAYKPLPSEL